MHLCREWGFEKEVKELFPRVALGQGCLKVVAFELGLEELEEF